MSKAVFLIHGFLSEMNEYDEIHQDLYKRYDYICKPTMPGHGKDGECDYNKFTEKETFKLLLDSFDELQKEYDEIDVIGFSMGGALAAYLSSVRKFNKLVLISPANKYFNPKTLITSTIYAMRLFRLLEKSIKIKDEREQDAYRNLLASFTGDFHESKGFLLRKFIKSYIWKAYKEFRDIVINCNKDLKEITNPTLILWGKLDQLVPEKSARELFNICTNEERKLIIYEEYTHLMLLSKDPHRIIDDILEFLDK